MPLRGDLIADERLQKCYTEQIIREAYARADWSVKHKDLMEASLARSEGRVHKRDRPSTAQLIENIKKLRGPPIPPEIKHTRKTFTTVYPELNEQELTEKLKEFNMKQAEPNIKKQIYHGISHFGEGRALYLKNRSNTLPEEKWKYSQTSSQDYGWRLKDTWKYQSPKFGRGKVIKDSFYRRTGVMGDSAYLGSKEKRFGALW